MCPQCNQSCLRCSLHMCTYRSSRPHNMDRHQRTAHTTIDQHEKLLKESQSNYGCPNQHNDDEASSFRIQIIIRIMYFHPKMKVLPKKENKKKKVVQIFAIITRREQGNLPMFLRTNPSITNGIVNMTLLMTILMMIILK